jgi:hypothetical protein
MTIQLLRNRQTTNPLGAILLLTDGQDNKHHNYSTLMEGLPEGVVCHTFATALGGFFACIAKQVRVKLKSDDIYNINHTHRTYQYEPKNSLSRQITFKMTDLNSDESRNLVFQLQLPKIKSDKNDSNDKTIGKLKTFLNNLII